MSTSIKLKTDQSNNADIHIYIYINKLRIGHDSREGSRSRA